MENKPRKVQQLKGTTGTEGERLEDIFPSAPVGAKFWHRTFSLFEYMEKTEDGVRRVNTLRQISVDDATFWLDDPVFDYGWRRLT